MCHTKVRVIIYGIHYEKLRDNVLCTKFIRQHDNVVIPI